MLLPVFQGGMWLADVGWLVRFFCRKYVTKLSVLLFPFWLFNISLKFSASGEKPLLHGLTFWEMKCNDKIYIFKNDDAAG